MRSRNLLVPLAAASLLLAAGCGSSGEEASDTTGTTAAAGSDATDAPATTAEGSVESTVLPKPEVSLPEEIPTELVVTDLVEGTGPAAAEGDTVLVHYVGVRSETGEEFDNSYDSGSPFSVNLGAGGVIQGWDEGLVGVKQGGRRQLDIPAELAYGDQPSGDVIQPGDALSFVIDVVAVVPASDPADAPTGSVAPSAGATEVTTEDVVVGEGDEVVDGSEVYVEIVAYDGATGAEIDSTWGNGGPVQLQAAADQTITGLYEGLLGMQPGGRRVITMPPADAFGDGGNEQLGLPAGSDLILVVDLVSIL